jgi:hypothetical protein
MDKNNDNNSNDNDNYNYNYNDEFVRPPDQIKRERLIPTFLSQEELDIQNAIKMSNELAEKYDNEQMDKLMNKIRERDVQFRNIKFTFTRISKVDKEVFEIYEIIEDIINSYISNDIDFYVWDNETHGRIFKVIKNMRFNKEELKILTDVMRYENMNL